MSLITQCPACSTMFRVVPDQLRISEGWVRCGQCDEVFDANVHLHSLEAAAGLQESFPHSPQPLPSPPPPPEPTYDWGPILSEPEPVVGALVVMDQELAVDEDPSAQAEAPLEALAPSPPADPEPDPDAAHEPLADEVAEPVESAPIEDEWAPTLHVGIATEEAEMGDLVARRADALVDDPMPSFMEERTEATAGGISPKALIVACSLLVLLLLGQVLLQERDRLAAVAPALQPELVAVCDVLGCSISPPKDIESIAIDSSAFTSVRPGVYLLQVNLKNAATTALATPALELTLTDTQDRPLLRRVLLPAELVGKTSLAAGAEMGASLPISVKAGATSQKISGYKVLAFYP